MRFGGLELGGRLDRYVGKLFTASFGTAFLLVIGLFVMADLAANVDYFVRPGPGGEKPGLALMLHYYLLNLPFLYLQVGPFVTLVGGMFTVARLMKHSEVTAVLDAGVSAQRLLVPVLFGGVLAAVGMFALREWATEGLGARRFRVLDRVVERREEPVLEEVWLKNKWGEVRVGRFHFGAADQAGARIEGLEVYMRTGPGGWILITADEARWVAADAEDDGGWWELTGGSRELWDEERPPAVPLHMLEGDELTPRDVIVAHRAENNPMELSFREARVLAAHDPDNVQFQTLLQYLLTFPLANVVLLGVGLPFLLIPRRGQSARNIAIGFLLCVFYYSLDFVARSAGMEGALSPLMASWLPLLVFGSLGVVLFAFMRS